MDFFDKHKALIITGLVFCITVLGLVNIKLRNSDKDIASTLIDLESFNPVEEEELQEEIPEEQEEAEPQTKSLATHRAYNEDQEESQNLDSRLKEIFERNSALSEEAETEENPTTSGEIDLSNNTRKERTERSDGDNTTEQTSSQAGSLKNSSISFSLLGRNAVEIPNPIYTCDRSGKVVINITVDTNGKVSKTSVNRASSTTSNECLTNKALEYAADAVFTPLPGRDEQPGTITYYFQG